MTVEEGAKAILECPGFVPDPQDPREDLSVFTWYKSKASDISRDGRIINETLKVAMYDKTDAALFTYVDLKGRATVDGISGALEIPNTRVSDSHIYTCYFFDTSSGNILKEARLTITGDGYYKILNYYLL